MLGELIGEGRGQVTSNRVLPTEPGQGPRVEVSFESNGTLLDVVGHELATYWAVARADGTLYGEGQGLITSPQGDMATWRGSGVGRMNEAGGSEFRGAIYFESASPRLVSLNGIAGVYEFSVDQSGKTEARIWEWK
jgi:hypothetical protein